MRPLYPRDEMPAAEFYRKGTPCFMCLNPVTPDHTPRQKSFCSPECYAMALLTPERWVEITDAYD